MHTISLEEPYQGFIAMRDSEDTKIAYAGDLGRFRDWAKVEPWQASKEDINRYFSHMMQKGLAHITLQRTKAAFFKFYRYLNNTLGETSPHYRKDDPSSFLRDLKLKSHKVSPKALDEQQRTKVLESLIWEGPNATLMERQISLAIFLDFKTGLRRMEIAKMKWKDLYFDERKFFSLRKGKKEFWGNISAELLVKLKDYQLFTSRIDTEWVFFNRSNPSKHLDKATIASFFRVIKKRVGFDKSVQFSTHCGRRVFCTTLHEKKVPDLEAIKMSGHESVEMYKRYVRIDEAKVKNTFDNAIS